MTTSIIDSALVFSFVKRLVSPFSSWAAFKSGVIDSTGEILIPEKQRTPEQKKSLQKFDVLVLNLKKLLARVPGGSSTFATFAAALMLLKESEETLSNNENLEELFKEYIKKENIMEEVEHSADKHTKFLKSIGLHKKEDYGIGSQDAYGNSMSTYQFQDHSMHKSNKPEIASEKIPKHLIKHGYSHVGIKDQGYGLSKETYQNGKSVVILSKTKNRVDKVHHFFDGAKNHEFVKENAPTNNIGSGNIAGVSTNDIVINKKKLSKKDLLNQIMKRNSGKNINNNRKLKV